MRAFKAGSFDVIVADIRLKGRSGVDLLGDVRKEDPDFPFILLTGFDSLESAIQAVRLGAQDYILKPLDGIDDLLGPVEKAVCQHRILLRNRALERELRFSEARFRTVLENSADVIYQLNIRSGVFDYVSPSLTAVFGYGVEEFKSMSIGQVAELVHPEDREAACRLVERIKACRPGNGRLPPVEGRIRTRGNDYRWICATHAVLFGSDERPESVVGNVRDISERQHAEIREKELRRRRRELYHMERVHTVGELASSLAHEINQPLAGILSNAQAAQRFLARTEPDLSLMREILADIVADDKRAGEVIRRLCAALRKEEPKREIMDVNASVRNVIALVHGETVVRNVFLVAELTEGLPRVCADKIQIEQVVLNLILNAEQAMTDVALPERKLVVSTARDTPDRVTIVVRDAGPGIPREKLEQVFEPFYTTKAKGLGMGLAISRSIVTAHGGRIWAENKPDGGARFCFSLPAAEENAERGARNAERGKT